MATTDHRHDDQRTSDEFHALVSMPPIALEEWLDTAESKSVGQKTAGRGESTGHHMDHEIVDLLHIKKSDFGQEEISKMRKVTGYVKRHLAQRPDGDVTETPWRRSLMNWGHDPLKK